LGTSKQISIYVLLTICLVVVFVLQLVTGSFSISITDVFKIFSQDASVDFVARNILLESRLPAALAALIAGASLSLSGLQMQTFFRNPVAGPYVLGISSGASLGVACLLLLFSVLGISTASEWGIILAATVGASVVFLLVLSVSYRIQNSLSLLIVGLMIASGVGAVIDILQTLASAESLKHYIFWSFGSFHNVTLEQISVLSIICLIGIVFSFYLAKPLNILLIGEEYALTSGIQLKRVKLLIVLCTCLLAGSVTAFCGPVGFVGLAVPHLARGVFKTTNHTVLTMGVILLGALVCSLCNWITNLPFLGLQLPINAVTSLLGAPFVIWIVLRNRAA
jgi:iron complex transport system permease protein